MSRHVIRPPTLRIWFTAPVIAGLLLTGCAAHTSATASPRPKPTHPISCPAGTHLRAGDCLNNGAAAPADPPQDASPNCPPSTHLRAGDCLNNVHITRTNAE